MCYGPGAMETTIYATYASRKKQFIATMKISFSLKKLTLCYSFGNFTSRYRLKRG